MSSEKRGGTVSKQKMFSRWTGGFAQGIEEKSYSWVIFQNKKLHRCFSQSLRLAPQLQGLTPAFRVCIEGAGARTYGGFPPPLPLPSRLLWLSPPSPPILHTAPGPASLAGNSILKTAAASLHFLIFSISQSSICCVVE